MKPEERVRQGIDDLLALAGWTVQDRDDIDLSASVGVAVREHGIGNVVGVATRVITPSPCPRRFCSGF